MHIRMTNQVNLDPAMPVTVLTSLKIVMKQLALGVNTMNVHGMNHYTKPKL